MGDYPTLPTTDDNLETNFTAQQILDVEAVDETEVCQVSSDIFSVFEFKDYVNINNPTFRWRGKSSLSTITSTVYLQIYNRDSGLWEDLDSDSGTLANTYFDLEATIPDITDYRDVNKIVTCRIYQEVK